MPRDRIRRRRRGGALTAEPPPLPPRMTQQKAYGGGGADPWRGPTARPACRGPFSLAQHVAILTQELRAVHRTYVRGVVLTLSRLATRR